jgi:hypothetical protein
MHLQMGSSYEERWQELGYASAATVVMMAAAVLGAHFVNHQQR